MTFAEEDDVLGKIQPSIFLSFRPNHENTAKKVLNNIATEEHTEVYCLLFFVLH